MNNVVGPHHSLHIFATLSTAAAMAWGICRVREVPVGQNIARASRQLQLIRTFVLLCSNRCSYCRPQSVVSSTLTPNAMSLCSLCQSIDIFNIPKLKLYDDGYGVYAPRDSALVSIINRPMFVPEAQRISQPIEHPGPSFHPFLDDLEAAAKQCAICIVVQRQVAQFKAQLETERKNGNTIYVGRGVEGPDWKMSLAKGGNETGGFMVLSCDAGRPSQLWVLAAVGFCVDGKYC